MSKGLLIWATLGLTLITSSAHSAGIMETPETGQARGPMSQQEIAAFMPARGAFTFPAPYGTKGWRLTSASDCPTGEDCVNYVGYSYWPITNNHEGSDEMLIFVGLERQRGGPGPSIIRFDKTTETASAPEPIFAKSDARSWQSGNGWYFSRTKPSTMYYAYERTLSRVDVLTGEQETVIDVAAKLGGNYKLIQAHSSADDTMHSFTLQDGSYNRLGCAVYNETTGLLTRIPALGAYDECQIDKTGRWLVIKEQVDGTEGEDNRIIDMATKTEIVLKDTEGAGGHSDMGYGYMIAADNYTNRANTRRVWRFDESPLEGLEVYSNADWGVQAPAHISHSNAKPGDPSSQYACGSSANSKSSIHANEIICFMLDGERNVLVVAPVMTNLGASGGTNYYNKLPKGNLDITGQYFLWTSNLGSNRLDLVMAKVPSQLLTGEPPEPEPEPCPVPEPCPTCPVPEPCPVCTGIEFTEAEKAKLRDLLREVRTDRRTLRDIENKLK